MESEFRMKLRPFFWLLGVIPLLASCASQPITLAPVGPQPVPGARASATAGQGQLQVFTQTEEYEADHDVPYFPHRDYQLYTADGKRLKRIWNHQDHEDESPAEVTLPAGHYLVKAPAASYGRVTVPVVIKPNQLTRVILQPGWQPGKAVASTELVQFPGGYPVGWRAEGPEPPATPSP
jgi:hypothetical protein